MDTLELLLRDEENYKQGVYWCIRRGDDRSRRLESLLRRDRVYLVEIDGFDEFMADLHKAAQLPLPKPIARPFDIARDRARLFVDVDDPLKSPFKSHPVISAHISEVLGSIETPSLQLPLPIQATILSSRGEVDRAISTWERAYEEDPTDDFIAHGYAEALADAEEYEKLVQLLSEAPMAAYHKTYFLLRAGRNQEVVNLATQVLAEPANSASSWTSDNTIVRINRAIALKRLECIDEMKNDLLFLEQNGYTASANIRSGVAALRGDKEAMFSALNESLYKSISPGDLMVFPVFEDYRDDPEFLEFIRAAIGD